MDSLTHIFFAHKLLVMTNGHISASICSLFPQIDRQPAYFHRMYAHPFFQIKRLADIGAYVYKRGTIKAGFEDDYAWSRFLEDYPRMRSFAEKYERESGYSLADFDPDYLSIVIAYASHTYQDIFNNPMQAFLPHSVYPCGKWELWSELDAIDFRTVLYEPSNIAAFREEFFGASLWNAQLDGTALIRAMISRTATTSLVQLPRSLVDDAFQSLGLLSELPASTIRIAEEFLIEHEHLLATMIRKYSATKMLRSQNKVLPVRS